MKRIIAFVICVLALTFGSLLHRGWVDMSVVDPAWDAIRSGAVHGWGWPLEFVADDPYPWQNYSLGTEDVFLLKPFLFDLVVFSLLVAAVVFTPVIFRRMMAE